MLSHPCVLQTDTTDIQQVALLTKNTTTARVQQVQNLMHQSSRKWNERSVLIPISRPFIHVTEIIGYMDVTHM